MSESKLQTLDGLCDLLTEQLDPATAPRVLYVGLEHLTPGRLVRSGGGLASEVQSHKFAFRKGDVLYGKLRPYLDKAVLADSDGVCTTELLVLRPKAGVDPRFLACVVHDSDFIDHAMAGVTGAHHPRTSWSHIAQFPLADLDKDEQTKIATLLWRIHDLLKANESTYEYARKLKGAAMRELFTRGLYGEPQKETEIGPLPKSWSVVRIGDQALMISKGASPKWQGFNYVREGVLFVRSQNVGDGFMDWHEKVFLPPEWNEKEKRSVLKSGDMLINLVGASIGRSAVGGPEIERANCNQAVCFVRLRQEEAHPVFLNGFLLTSEGQRQIHGSKKDIARANLSLEDVREMLMPKPQLNEQLEIVDILAAIDRKIGLHREKRAVLESLFKTLLHKLITGEILTADLDLSALRNEKEPVAV